MVLRTGSGIQASKVKAGNIRLVTSKMVVRLFLAFFRSNTSCLWLHCLNLGTQIYYQQLRNLLSDMAKCLLNPQRCVGGKCTELRGVKEGKYAAKVGKNWRLVPFNF